MAKKSKRKYRRYYPRRMYRRFRKGKQPIPMLPALAIANGALIQPLFGNDPHGVYGALGFAKDGNYEFAVREFIDTIGINFLGTKFSDGTRNAHWTAMMTQNYTAIAAGVIGHFIANKVGLNKVMKRVPYVGKYVSL